MIEIKTDILEENETNLKEKIRLDMSYINYHKIINKHLPYKFAYLDEWLLKKSKLLLRESESQTSIRHTYKTYKRGTIIKADFGVGIGSEMSQVHFAIVLNNYDNPKNNILTVIPLTSKDSKFNLDLGGVVIENIIGNIQKELDNLTTVAQCNAYELSIEETKKSNKLSTLLAYYKSNIKHTYACCSLITTISKERIFLPINEYDIIGKVKCSNEIMDKLDAEIKKRFTKFDN